MMAFFWVLLLCGFVTSRQIQTVCSAGQNGTQESLARISMPASDLLKINNRLQKLEDTVLRLTSKVDWRNSSFTAIMTSDTVFENNGVVRFPKVILNIAPPTFGYDEKISFYRCPYDGIYVFSMTLCGQEASEHHYSIMKEGEVQVAAYTNSAAAYISSSATVVIQCKRGEDVWVANTRGAARTIDADNYRVGYSFFTGFRLA